MTQLRRPLLLIVLVALALVGVGTTLYASQWGPWAFSDGVGYLVTARNLIEGKGLGIYRPSGAFVPTVTHPPLFPYLLAAFTSLGGDVLQASRGLNAALIAVFVIAVPLLFRRIVGLSSLAAILGLLLIIHPAISLMFVSAMSEPLFVVTGTSSLLMICFYLSSPKIRYLAAACALAAGAMLTRYVGLAYVATGALALLAFDDRSAKRQRLFRAGAYSFAAILPTFIFLAYWAQTPYARTVRGFAMPPSFSESLSLFVSRVGQSAWSWKPLPTAAVLNEIARSPGERMALGLVLLGLVLAAIATARWIDSELAAGVDDQAKLRAPDPWLLPKVFSLFAALFLGGMLLAFVFSAPTPDIDSRTLFPILPTALIIALGLLSPPLASRPRPRAVHWTVAGAAFAFAAGSLPATLDIVTGIHRTGLGYTAREWHQSETIRFVKGLDPQVVLVSNSPEAIMLFTGRSAYPVPSLQPSDSRPPDSASEQSASGIDPLICGEGGYLVLFNQSLDGVDPQIDPAAVPGTLSCQPALAFRAPDGSVYSNRLTSNGGPR